MAGPLDWGESVAALEELAALERLVGQRLQGLVARADRDDLALPPRCTPGYEAEAASALAASLAVG
jgi:hypothetical protein